jgi:hypothetical protein
MMKFRHFRLILSRSSISTAKHCNGVKKGGLFLLSLSLSLSLSRFRCFDSCSGCSRAGFLEVSLLASSMHSHHRSLTCRQMIHC